MLERHTSIDGVVTYRSRLLTEIGTPHAFSTRLGGLSVKPFDSMNLGNPNGCDIQDLTERIRKNYRILLRATGLGERDWMHLHQVHGARVVRVERGKPHDNSQKADVLVGDDPNRVLSVRVADCVPVLLASDDGKLAAAVHAGWRGVIDGAAVAAMEEMNRWRDVPSSRIVAAIGPSIGFDAFDVGPEVLDEFSRVFGNNAPIRRCEDGKGYVDLREALRRQLLVAGVPEGQIDLSDRCTHTHADEFFSHRRDKGVTGRMAAVIAPISR
ncbi:MAG TPA: peptidoglycan editing factor PgeF [Tepidisphaeraceae bacterium]